MAVTEKIERTHKNLGSSVQDYLPELILLAVVGVLYLLNSGLFDIDPFSELFHIQAAREMVLDGRFWMPELHGHDYLIRGPLWTWIVTAFFKVLGVSLWTARFPAVIFALGGLVLTYMVSASLTQSRFSAIFAAAGLATTWGYFHLATLSTGDILATDLFLGFAWLLLEWQPLASRRQQMAVEQNVFSAGFGAVIGLMLLAKGGVWAGLMICIGVLYLGMTGSLHLLERLNYRYLLPLIILIPLPWMAWVSIKTTNPFFMGDYLFVQPFCRLIGTGPWQGLHTDLLFYLRRLPAGLMPYAIFLPAFLWEGARPRRSSTILQPWMLWLCGWFLLGVILLSLSAFQEPTLILPFYPPVLILIGYYLDRMMELPDGTPIFNNTMAVYLLGLMTFAVLGTIIIFQVVPSEYTNGFWHLPGMPVLETLKLGKHEIQLEEAFPIWKLWLIPGAFILLLGGIAVFVMQLLRRTQLSMLALFSTSLVFLFFVKILYLPVMHRPVPEVFAAQLNKQARPGDEIVLYSLHPDVKRILFYLQPRLLRQIHFVHKPEGVTAALAQETAIRNAVGGSSGTVYGIIREKSYFNDLDYDARTQLRINGFNWKWDTNRLSELNKLLFARQPVFDRMKSGVVLFQSIPGGGFNLEPAMLLQPGQVPESEAGPEVGQ